MKTDAQLPPIRVHRFLLERVKVAAMVTNMTMAAFVRRALEAQIRATERRAGFKLTYPGVRVLREDIDHALRQLERAARANPDDKTLSQAAVCLRDSASRTFGTAPIEEPEKTS